MSKILITGATGHLGTAVTELIIKKASAENISVLVRSEEKSASFKALGVNVLIGDYNDYSSLLAAFKGIDKLYMISGTELAKRAQQQIDVVNAAKEAGVNHIVYTSFQRTNETESSPIAFVAQSHLKTEQQIKASGLAYTILEHGLYTDMIPIFAGQQLLQNHTIFLPAGDNKTAFASRTDLAEAAVNILLDESGKFNNKSIELAGSESISWSEIAETIADITSLPIVYVPAKNEDFVDASLKAGVPEEYVGMFKGFSNAIKDGEFANASGDLEEILGRKPVSVKEYLERAYAK